MEPFRRQYLVDNTQAIRALRQIDQENRRLSDNSRTSFRKSNTEWERYGKTGTGVSQRIGQYAQRWVAGVAAAAFTTLAVAIGKSNQKRAEFLKGLAEINTLGDGSAVALKRIERGVLAVATRVGGGELTQYTKALYDIKSAGYDGADGLQVLEASARGAVGGVTNISVAADLLTSVLNAYNLKASDATSVSDKLFATVRAGKTTIPELAASLGKVAPAAAAADIPLEELLAGVATLTASGLSTAESVTRMRGAIQAFVKPTDDAKELAKQLGIELNATSLKNKGFAGSMDDVARATGGNSEKLAVLFSNTEAYEAAVQLAGKQSETFKRNLDSVTGSAGDALRAFDKMKNETDQLSGRLRNKLDSILIKLAEKTLPAYNAALAATIKLTKTFDTPAQRLLEILKDLPDADPKIVAELEVQVDRQALQKELQAAQDILKKNGQLEFLSETQREDILRGSDDLTKSRFLKFNTEEQDLKSLRSLQKRIVNSLEDTRVNAKDDFFGRIATSQVVNTYERQLEAINQVIEARTTLEGVNEALAATEEQLDQIRKGDLPSKDEPVIPEDDNTNGNGDKSKITEEDIARAKEVLTAISRGNELLALTTEKQRDALEEVFRIKDEIKKLDESAKVLGEKAVAEQRTLLQQRLEKAEAAVKKETELVERIAVVQRELQKIKPRGLDTSDNSQNALVIAQGVIDNFATRMTALQNAFSSGELTKPEYFQRLKEESDAFTENLSKMYQRLKDLGLLTPELEAAFEQAFGSAQSNIDGVEKKTKKLDKTLGNIASTLRSLTNFADVFGGLDGDVERLITSTADVLDNLERLAEVKATIGKEGGPAAGSFSAIAAQAVPLIGVGAGIASFVGGLISEGEKQRAEMQRLASALRDNVRAVRAAIAAEFEGGQIGENVSQEDVTRAQAILERLRGTGLSGDDRQELLAELESLGINALQNVGDLYNNVRDLIRSNKSAESLLDAADVDIGQLISKLLTGDQDARSILESFGVDLSGLGPAFDDLITFLDNLKAGLGEFTNDVAGAIERLQFFNEFLGESGPEALNRFLDSLLAIEGISEPLREKLEEILGLDLSTPEGRSRLQEIIEAVAGSVASGASAFLGGLSPDEVEEILRTLKQFTEGGALDGENTNQNYISRTITEFQAGDLLVIAEEQLYTLQQILGELRGEDTSGVVPLFGGAGPSIEVPGVPLPNALPLSPTTINRTTQLNIGQAVFQGRFVEEDIVAIERHFSRWIRSVASDPNQVLGGGVL